MAKKLELKTVPLGGSNEEEELDYRKMLVDILRMPSNPQAGLNYAEMEERLKLIEKVGAADDHVILEDAEWRVMWEAFKAFRFTQVFAGVVQLGADLKDAEIVDLNADAKAQ